MKGTGRTILKNFVVNMSKKSAKINKNSMPQRTDIDTASSTGLGPLLTSTGPVSTTSNNGDIQKIQIPIHVKPGAKSNCITDFCKDYWSVQIAAPPTDGEANAAIIKFFAQLLGLRKSDVELRGGKSRDKVVTVTSSLDSAKVAEMLKAELGKIH